MIDGLYIFVFYIMRIGEERKVKKFPGTSPRNFLVAEMGFEPHGLAKFSAENLASVTSRL